MEDRCVSCGTIIPEGQQVCPQCLNPVRKETELKPCEDCPCLNCYKYKCKSRSINNKDCLLKGAKQ